MQKEFKLTSNTSGRFSENKNQVLFISSFIISGTILFLLLAYLVHSGITQAYDIRILSWFREADNLSKPIGPVWLPETARDITSLGSETILTISVICISLFFLLKKRYSALSFILASSISGFIIDTLLKNLINRERPDLFFRIVYVASKSFPSGHAMMSVVIYFSMVFIFIRGQYNSKIRTYLITTTGIIIFLIGISRVYLGVHYPSDVFGGWIAGFTWVAICMLADWYFEKRMD